MIAKIIYSDKAIAINGCENCMRTYNLKTEKERILSELHYNIAVAKQTCDFYNINFENFIKEIMK